MQQFHILQAPVLQYPPDAGSILVTGIVINHHARFRRQAQILQSPGPAFLVLAILNATAKNNIHNNTSVEIVVQLAMFVAARNTTTSSSTNPSARKLTSNIRMIRL